MADFFIISTGLAVTVAVWGIIGVSAYTVYRAYMRGDFL